jgi:hypothetical protein
VADLKIVSLEEVVERDPTLNNLFQLNYGWQARRVVEAADWQEEEYESEEDSSEET